MSPFGKGGLNSYAYCLNDPINRVDPTGHFSFLGITVTGRDLVVMGVGAAVGIMVGAVTCGAGLPLVLFSSVLAAEASDVATGMFYDALIDKKGPTLQSIRQDAIVGALSGLGGELAGRALGFTVKALRWGGRAV
ncbi:hypothetical protein TWF481_003967 [Arthrobotrys musiformis]|uniref:RHS repeat-associated core domain-containing protein n=1 Tax=Arthrobotrys musiformis TaxID=47236 RepID=A0AAV9WK69_9PEZI